MVSRLFDLCTTKVFKMGRRKHKSKKVGTDNPLIYYLLSFSQFQANGKQEQKGTRQDYQPIIKENEQFMKFYKVGFAQVVFGVTRFHLFRVAAAGHLQGGRVGQVYCNPSVGPAGHFPHNRIQGRGEEDVGHHSGAVY